ncbi:hypothetical protein GCM10010140_39080 [Streptosporangium pseudovulgare]|uniref:Uncharacterized protein n=1 Tax=Streptosporangium pseudovulgare TaxID=35765 RepID=A0ABQ2R015_9ACTN|nr:hypothetical protein GCM10010140_39080 [Streptosporangium pseudovulgare]
MRAGNGTEPPGRRTLCHAPWMRAGRVNGRDVFARILLRHARWMRAGASATVHRGRIPGRGGRRTPCHPGTAFRTLYVFTRGERECVW